MTDTSPNPIEPTLDEAVQERLTAVVQWLSNQAELPLSSLELAEILWLGPRIQPHPTRRPKTPTRTQAPAPQPANPAPQQADPAVDAGARNEPPAPLEPPAAPSDATLPWFFPATPQTPAPEPAALLLPKVMLPDAADGAAALPVRVAEAPPLGDRFALLQALRPLLGRKRDPLRRRLNETATVERFAESRLLLPVLEPRLVPRFEQVVVLVDGGVSMQVWHKLAHELRQVLNASQGFAQVRLVFLQPQDLDGGQGAIPLQLVQPSCSLLLFLSDAAGRHWWDGRMFAALESWCRTRPTVLLQMLPIWHWPRTALVAGDRVSVSNAAVAAANGAYSASRLDWWEEEAPPGSGFTLPVILPDRAALAGWSAMVMGDPETATSGVLLPGPKERRQRLEAVVGDGTPEAPPPPPSDRAAVEALWQTFRQVASPQAQRLLMVLASAPMLTLPVMALLKEAKVPESTTPLPIAEILVSSLVRRKPGQEGISDADQLQFELLPAMADLLLERLSPGDRLDVIRAVTAVVEKRWNRLALGPSFEALLCDPNVVPPAGLEGAVQFASVLAGLLETLPGEKARQFTQRLRQGVGLEPADPWPKDQFVFETVEFSTAQLLPIPESETITFSTARYQELELRPIQFETARLTTAKPNDPTPTTTSHQPAVAIHRSEGSAWAFFEPLQRNSLPPGATAAAADSLTLTMVEIPAGTFLMGSPPNEPERADNEGPQHEVTLESFFISQTPITKAQWEVVANWKPMEGEIWGRNLDPEPSMPQDLEPFVLMGITITHQCPVCWVSWYDAMEFCNRLCQRTGRYFTLPSEAQWEYSCRAGTTKQFSFGETISPELANYGGNSRMGDGPNGEYFRERTTQVEKFHANPWGLYDMHGNLREWCADDWHICYEGAPTDGTAWLNLTSKEDERLNRGGSWLDSPSSCRSASRSYSQPFRAINNVGFRVVCVHKNPPVNP